MYFVVCYGLIEKPPPRLQMLGQWILYPRSLIKAVRSDWTILLRLAVSVGIVSALVAWSNSIKAEEDGAAPTSDFIVENDVFVRWLMPFNDKLIQRPDLVPLSAAPILSYQYLLVLIVILFYINNGDYILPGVVTSWMLAICLTYIVKLPKASHSIPYYENLPFLFERYISNTTVSWHALILTICSANAWKIAPHCVMTTVLSLLWLWTVVFLFVMQTSSTIAVFAGTACGLLGLKVQDFIKRKLGSSSGPPRNVVEESHKAELEAEEIQLSDLDDNRGGG